MIRKFVCYFWFSSWDHLSLGISVCIHNPNIEIHVPFGFVRIGWEEIPLKPSINWNDIKWRGHGWMAERIYKGSA